MGRTVRRRSPTRAPDVVPSLGEVEMFLDQGARQQIFFSGAQLYVEWRGEVLIDAAYGYASADAHMSPDTIVRVYCATKPVVAIALLAAESDGHLSLNDQLGNFLRFSDIRLAKTTVLELISHRAGFPQLPPSAILLDRDLVLEQLLSCQPRPDWDVDTPGPCYSVFTNYFLVGEVLEAVVRESAGVYAKRRVIDRLGIPDLWVNLQESDLESIQARLGHNVALKCGQLVPVQFELVPIGILAQNCAFGGYGNARAIGTFWSALASTEAAAGAIGVLPERLESMRDPTAPPAYDPFMGRVCTYGTGLMVDLRSQMYGNTVSPLAFGHSAGDGGGFAFHDPAAELTVAVHINSVDDAALAVRVRRPFIIDRIYRGLGLGCVG